MRDNPLMLCLLVGLIVILVIAGVSVLVKANALTADYQKEISRNIEFQKTIEVLKKENQKLQVANSGFAQEQQKLNTTLSDLQLKMARLQKLKQKLEKDLGDELLKKDQPKEQPETLAMGPIQQKQ